MLKLLPFIPCAMSTLYWFAMKQCYIHTMWWKEDVFIRSRYKILLRIRHWHFSFFCCFKHTLRLVPWEVGKNYQVIVPENMFKVQTVEYGNYALKYDEKWKADLSIASNRKTHPNFSSRYHQRLQCSEQLAQWDHVSS